MSSTVSWEEKTITKILNLTNHEATPEQIAQGVCEPDEKLKVEIESLITFDTLPSRLEMQERAHKLCIILQQKCSDYNVVMIGGAPFFTSILANSLCSFDFLPVYAVSNRSSIESLQPDGSVVKLSSFKHLGFIPERNDGNFFSFFAGNTHWQVDDDQLVIWENDKTYSVVEDVQEFRKHIADCVNVTNGINTSFSNENYEILYDSSTAKMIINFTLGGTDVKAILRKNDIVRLTDIIKFFGKKN